MRMRSRRTAAWVLVLTAVFSLWGCRRQGGISVQPGTATGAIYKVYNGLETVFYPFDPEDPNALAFAG